MGHRGTVNPESLESSLRFPASVCVSVSVCVLYVCVCECVSVCVSVYVAVSHAPCLAPKVILMQDT